ncbi:MULTISPECIES: ATP-binding protein [Pseudomonas]|uniref:ATP-binding protein n=1 Tax=Pseudomonas TaxID=286 RepID=UPI0015F6AFDF|nr:MULTISPECIES: ATP-binding protein [Pseudomonas]MBA6120778.1 ATP-binding protein [Pseudomonas juntendi]WBM34283.1 ATP-binding protein [Pseudomonas sp. NY11382]
MADRTSNFRRLPQVITNQHVTENCRQHGEIPIREIEQFDGSYLRMPCSKCRWEAINRSPMDVEKYKAAMTSKSAERINDLLIGSGITPRFRECTLESFSTNGEEEKARALAACKAYVDRFTEHYRDGRSMILTGNVGTGKTHLASAMVQAVIRRYGAEALIVPVAEVFRVAKGAMTKGADYDERDVINELAEVDLLVIDEVGAQRGSEYEQALLHEVIDRRYQLVVPTILVSNLPADELKAFIGDRALDRLRQGGGKAVGFTWSSARGEA